MQCYHPSGASAHLSETSKFLPGYIYTAASGQDFAHAYYPSGIALSLTEQELYFSDFANHCIRKIVLSSALVTVVGGRSKTPGYQVLQDIYIMNTLLVFFLTELIVNVLLY